MTSREVEVQERELGVLIDTIIVCSVTGSTQAGMIAGRSFWPAARGPRRAHHEDLHALLAALRASSPR